MACLGAKTKFQFHRLVMMQQKRFKKKTAFQSRQKTHKELALQFFDTFYSQYYGKLWPSLRISLLSKQKYGALLNNLECSEVNTNESKLIDLGAFDFIEHARGVASLSRNLVSERKTDQVTVKNTQNMNQRESRLSEDANENDCMESNLNPPADFEKNNLLSSLVRPVDDKNTSLYDFIPADRVYSEKELADMKIIKKSTFEDHDIPVSYVSEEFPQIHVPETLKAFCFDRGNIDLFPDPLHGRRKKLGYYLMDAASVLPVIALNIKHTDNVLDMCSAPGGKMLTMLQYHHSGNLVCNDASKSRLQRLSHILDSYGNQTIKDKVEIQNLSGMNFTEPLFDKVLVDAPCTNDRHSLLEDDNNMFKPGRLNERLEIPNLQRNLLVSAIMSCKPGGEVVYSTCSLSPAQNDGIIQAAMEHIWKETKIDVCVVDLEYFPKTFRKIFNFYPKCRFGQLVLPSLTANFGPMYFCKLKRLNT